MKTKLYTLLITIISITNTLIAQGIDFPRPPRGAWDGVLGTSMPCAMRVFVIDIIVISKVYNFVFMSLPYLMYVTFWVKDLLAVVSFIK
jgi:hypothetical protein